ncbi:MAG: LptF/LptG family permease [Candidatus Kapaibacterium sp.]|nr:LptF/LptG family permease [Ignavibacteriota bacterium]
MKIIYLYILRAHIGPFLFGFSTVVFIFLMQFIINSLDKLLGKGIETSVIVQAIALNIPWMVVLAAPMGILFATLMAFGAMSANYEVPIIKSSGTSLYSMMKPVIGMGIVVSLLLFWFNDYILPESNHQAKVLMNDIQRKKPTFAIQPGEFSPSMGGNIILSRAVDSITGRLHDVTIYDYSRTNQQNIISADSGQIGFSSDYSNLIINLFSGEIHQRNNNDIKDYKIIDFKEYQIKMEASGFDFNRTDVNLISRGDREMRIRDMQEVVDKNKSEAVFAQEVIDSLSNQHLDYLLKGVEYRDIEKEKSTVSTDYKVDTNQRSVLSRVQKNVNFLSSDLKTKAYTIENRENNIRKYEVEIWKKYSIPLACFVFVFVGVPLGIRTKGGNFGISAAISLGFYIIYWGCLIAGEKLADKGIISPLLGMFFADIIIFFVGILLMIRINNEMFQFRNIFNKEK